MDNEPWIELLAERVIGCAIRAHRTLGPGFVESVYQNALTHEFRKEHIAAECGKSISVHYDGICVGNFVADVVIENVLLLELKAVQTLLLAHEIQLVNYLAATRMEVGLLLNFGGRRVQVKRKYRDYVPGSRKAFGSCRS